MLQIVKVTLTADNSISSQQLTIVQAYELVVLGIIVSILLPILRKLLPEAQPAAAGVATFWSKVKPYVIIGAVSLVVAVVVIAFAGDAAKNWTWQTAILAGYAWDSTLQKVGKS